MGFTHLFIITISRTNAREDFGSATTTNTKMNSSVRGPRSGSNVLHKLSPIVQRTTMSNDWESSHCTSKVPTTVGSNNRKRTQSMRPSSPPVAHWAGQRSQKSSRTARRTNFVPIVSSNDESHGLDAMSDVAGNENGSGILRRLPSNSPQQVKSKSDLFSAAALSESEESGAAEIKSGDKVKKNDEVHEKPSHNVQKVSTLVLQPRKNKLVNGDDLGDGVRRQGRSGRGFTSSRSLMPMAVERLSNVGTAKQLRTMKLGFDKTERLSLSFSQSQGFSSKCSPSLSFFYFTFFWGFCSAKQVVHRLGDFLTGSLIHVKSTVQSVQQQIFMVVSRFLFYEDL